jgi:hypothetical protein
MSQKRGEPESATSRVVIAGVPIHVPIGTADVPTRRLAQRIPSLDGARIGILDNCKEFADVVLRGVAEALRELHPSATIRTWQKSYLGIASPYAEEMAAECDVVINGVGH